MKDDCPEHLNLPPEDNMFTFFPPKITDSREKKEE
jgi:hypothetical protein